MNTLKKHSLNFSSIKCQNCVNNINGNISKIEGINKVDAMTDGKVTVEYNLEKVTLNKIEKEINKLGYKTNLGIWGKIKRGFINFTEENEKSILNDPGSPCCSNPKGICDKKGE